MKKVKELTLQLKPVGNECNLRCEYCYAMPFRAGHIKVMNPNIIEKIIKESFEMTDHLVITWHGGEPTMPGLKYYEMVMNIVAKHKKPNQTIVNMIQTNATLITERYAKFFADNDFIVSVSIDGDEETHNRNRYYNNKIGSFAKTMQGVENLRKQGINPPVIATVSRNTYDDCEKTFNFFCDNGFKEIKYSPVYDSSEDEFSITCEEWYEYMKKVLELWTERGDDSIRVREIDEVLEWVLDSTINTCTSKNACIKWMSINEIGDIYPCEYLRATEGYGNINTMHLSDAFESEGYKRFLKKVVTIPNECQSCEFYSKCGNGCPANRVKEGKISHDGKYVYCNERKKLYNYIVEILNE